MHTVVISDFQALLNLKKAWLALMEQSACQQKVRKWT